jgi:hypothetical protein
MKNGWIASCVTITFFILAAGCANQKEELTTGLITGIITDALDLPLDSAEVITEPVTATVYTDDSGAFEIPDVQPGDYTVTANKRTYIPASANVQVTVGDVATADISLVQNTRVVLGEMLTTACHCADDARAEAYRTKSTLGDQFVYVEYHASIDPLFETWDPFATEASEARRLFFGADTFILGNWLFLDGTTLLTTAGNYEQTIDSLLGVYSPLALSITGSYASGAGTCDVIITAVDTITWTDLVVEFAIFERGPIIYSPSGPCLIPFEYFLVAMPEHEPLDINYGETITVSKTIAVPDTIGGSLPPFHAVNHTNIGIVVFVQSAGSQEILQAGSIEF